MILPINQNQTGEEEFEGAYVRSELAKIKAIALRCVNERNMEVIRHEAKKITKKFTEFGADNKNTDFNFHGAYRSALYAKEHAKNIEEMQLAMDRVAKHLGKMEV